MSEQPQLSEEQRKELEEKLKNMSPEELLEFQKKQCIFCQILSGNVPSKKIYDDDKCVAILDINPATKGHLLVIPKEHYAIMPQIPEPEIQHLFSVAKKLSQVLLRTLKVTGTNIFIANGLAAGQKSQHFMVHVIPRKEGDGIFAVEEKLIDKEMQQKIKGSVENKIFELLDVKKEVVNVKKKTVKKTKKEPAAEPEKEETEDTKEKELEETTEEEPEEPKEEHDDSEEHKEEETGSDEESDDNEKESEDSKDTEEKEDTEDDEDTEEESDDEQKKRDVNLDDIASLFK